MPPRLRCPAACGFSSAISPSRIPLRSAVLLWSSAPKAPTPAGRYASSQAASPNLLGLPDGYVPPTKPPTARPSDTRKAQLLRTYTSLLRSTPLILLFQHNNLTAVEWAAVRRELNVALSKVPVSSGDGDDVAPNIHLGVIRTRIFDVALKLVEFYDPSTVAPTETTTARGAKTTVVYNHDLSKSAFDAVKAVTSGETPIPESSAYAQLAPLLVGPVGILTFPSVSPAHLAAALSILSPSPPAFPAPTRRKSPGYYDPIAQSGLQKLMLIGGRVEGKVFDVDGVKWVGGIEGGLEGLRAQLVAMLQSAGLGLTVALEGAGKSLWLTMESRRSVLEEAEKGPAEEAPAAETSTADAPAEGEKKE
ncbi:hypothetical protein B0T24DRAFT_611118 [Lasiosphaeria ovina]|uniref:Uncharacterized protein n=1 Tax=Lasiosphaeria ovina TaxID=92902 RepID=A0AAE0KM71_9PEZI|nr:hypothetical protein B0T24DRAFT_611118 [Lasiosphaeria ovina]